MRECVKFLMWVKAYTFCEGSDFQTETDENIFSKKFLGVSTEYLIVTIDKFYLNFFLIPFYCNNPVRVQCTQHFLLTGSMSLP